MGGMRKVPPEPRGVRNNNPGNLKYVPGVAWIGQNGQDDDGFAIFDSADDGLRALARLLHTYAAWDGVRTIDQLIGRYAPGGVTSVDHYAKFVADDVGVSPCQTIDVDHLIPLIMRAIIWFENGQDPYTRPQIRDAVDEAREGE